MKIVIGIITHQRPQQVLRIARLLAPQLASDDAVWILENGSRQLNKRRLKSIHSQISLFHLPAKSIPIARNYLFSQAKVAHDFLLFLDDDVVVSQNWLSELKKQLKVAQLNQTEVVQGNFHSFPKQNIYAQTTEILTQLWLGENMIDQSHLKILDTKHVAFNLKRFQRVRELFDPTLSYASDIAAAALLTQRHHFSIVFAQNISVFHQERTQWWQFVQHRYRLSKSFRKVAEKYPNFFGSASTNQKFRTLWTQLKMTPLQKTWILFNLLLIYASVWVSNLITSLLRF